jgi:hypothetical protein
MQLNPLHFNDLADLWTDRPGRGSPERESIGGGVRRFDKGAVPLDNFVALP